MRAIPKTSLKKRTRELAVDQLTELELATDEAAGRIELITVTSEIE
jgi:hypothetical protein